MPPLGAVLGLARATAGELWLRVSIRRNRRLEPELLFAKTWSAASRLGFLNAGAELYDNCYGHDWKDILLPRVLRRMERAGVPFTPKVVVSGLDLLRADAKRPIVCITVHSPVDAVLNRIFIEAAFPTSVLAAGAGATTRRARLFGLRGDLDVIIRTDDALLMMRRRLADGWLVNGCVDFTRRMAGSLRRDVFVSPAMFDLARMAGASILYAGTRVSDEGAIEVALASPRIDVSASTGEACAEDFIAWLQTAHDDQRDFRVMRWDREHRHQRGLFALPRMPVRSRSPTARYAAKRS